MKKPKYKSGATFGKQFELKFDSWCNDLGITFFKDETISTGGRRRKDIKCDRFLMINGKEIFIELKTTTTKQSLDYALYPDGRSHKIKFHQIGKMHYLIIEYRDAETILITKHDFLAWACEQKKNSISYKDSKEIGTIIEGLEWILTSKSDKPE